MKNKYFFYLSGKVLILLLIISGFFACDNKQSSIPVVAVDITIDLLDPLYQDLQLIGGYVYITGGVNGLIIYHSSQDEYQAFERTCPHDPDKGKVWVDEGSAFTAVDSEKEGCGSEFSLLLDGAVSQGPSKFPLKMYKCIYYQSSSLLRITN